MICRSPPPLLFRPEEERGYFGESRKNKQGYKAIGFWVEHLNEDRSNDNLIDYVVSIDELERLTGIDFFCNLPDDEEEQAERIVYPNTWGLR